MPYAIQALQGKRHHYKMGCHHRPNPHGRQLARQGTHRRASVLPAGHRARKAKTAEGVRARHPIPLYRTKVFPTTALFPVHPAQDAQDGILSGHRHSSRRTVRHDEAPAAGHHPARTRRRAACPLEDFHQPALLGGTGPQRRSGIRPERPTKPHAQRGLRVVEQTEPPKGIPLDGRRTGVPPLLHPGHTCRPGSSN